ncbi:HupE/UreJ family protein [Akkermansiaceae bacterium]|nr:HupE/UreJ family protein [Akkermansiaceae bacterium]
MLRLIIVAILGLFVQVASAHTVDSVLFSFLETGKSWRVQIILDASLALRALEEGEESFPISREWLCGLEQEDYQKMRVEAESFLRKTIVFTHANEPLLYEVSFPDFSTEIPEFPKLLNGDAYLTVEIVSELSNKSGDFTITVAEDSDLDIIVSLKGADEEGEEKLNYLIVEPGQSELLFTTTPSEVKEVEGDGAFALLKLGFEHVVPQGLDHVLFVLCLFLMARQWRVLLTQSLVFTIAHSLTLGLAISGVLQMEYWPPFLSSWIEPLIAVSILVLALENVLRKEVTRNRYLVIFGFGLIHGLGFAGSLGAALQQSSDGWIYPLALANLGVELAQVTVLISAWILTLWLAESERYEIVRKGLSLLIAAIAAWMVIERVLL